MPYAVTCIDRPDAGTLRQRTRARHLAYMIEHRRHVLYGGPLQSEDGSRVIGSLMVLDFQYRPNLERFLSIEPYCLEGLFRTVTVHRLRQMVPETEEGLLEREFQAENVRTVDHQAT